MDKILPRIVVVEDEQPIRNQLLMFLEDYDEFRLAEAESGEIALEMLRREPADVCIVDVRLPGMDGMHFIQAAVHEGLSKFFIVHTGSADDLLSEKLRRLGLADQDIFLKPSDLRLVLARLREILSRSNG